MAAKKAKTFEPEADEPMGEEVEVEESSSSDFLTVVSTQPANADGGYPCVLWEKNPAHPNGEAMITGPTPVKVGLTAAVAALLHDGKLEEVID